MTSGFTAESLPLAIKSLLELNNYSVSGPVQVHGAEIDLVAEPMADPFGSKIYIEATVEYVNNDKYGKDVGKLALVGEKDRDAKRLIISSQGFSLPVRERAQESRIETLTYDELFSKFERFDRYIKAVLDVGELADELNELEALYEEPFFEDAVGRELATDWLASWRTSENAEHRWLVIVGEYGTGKTTLTKILQRRWVEAYRSDPSLPLPFRIELRDFNRQFDARGLLHHFLDQNQLGYVSIDFVFSLIKSGKLILLLDGYDEMAQFLSLRERRSCLTALAQLSGDGARGILTSRPNFFTETEEFHIFDLLYSSIEGNTTLLTSRSRALIEQERRLDEFVESHYLERYERVLRDLSPEQTEDLIRRSLADDPDGQAAVLAIMRRVFRSGDEGAKFSLSGKPVIISYLLDVVGQLRENRLTGDDPLTEWEVYKLVIDELMIRDFRQTSVVMPEPRRAFLRLLSERLSTRNHHIIGEGDFKDLVRKSFQKDLRFMGPEDRQRKVDELFEDLRRSGTLTRSSDSTRPGWRFSHNSLREFLLCERLIQALMAGNPITQKVPISDAMRLFVASKPAFELEDLVGRLAAVWGERESNPGMGQLLTLLWDGLLKNASGAHDRMERLSDPLRGVAGHTLAFNQVSLSNMAFSSELSPANLSSANFSGSEIVGVSLSYADMRNADFSGTIIEGAKFDYAQLEGANFSDSILVDADFAGADLTNADFRGIERDSTLLFTTPGSVAPVILTAEEALGFLRYQGAKTDDVGSYYIFMFHPKFDIIVKIVRKLAEQSIRQRIGLLQKGAARQDTKFAIDFFEFLEKEGFVYSPGGRDNVVSATEAGRKAFVQLVEQNVLHPKIEDFLVS
jgi:hypothetical protein